MSILLEKSEKSVSAAGLLHQECYYATSIHCSYYSCLQLMLYIVFNYFGEDENEFTQKQKDSERSLHNYIINYIYSSNTLDINSKRTFNKIIHQLKAKRVDADYKEIILNESDSDWAIKNSEKVNNILNTSFKI